jgi:hypothetical protein
MTTTENPIDNDDRLKGLLSAIKDVDSRKAYNTWRKAFLKIYTKYLDSNGILNGKDGNYRLLKQLENLENRIDLVQKTLLNKNNNKNALTTPNGRRLLTNLTQEVVATERKVQELMPKTKADEERFGFDKFELAAVLLEDGFHGYDQMIKSRNVLHSIAEQIDIALGVGSNNSSRNVDGNFQQIILGYSDSVESFIKVMEDLKLCSIMNQCVDVVYQGKERPKPRAPPQPQISVEPEEDLAEDSSVNSCYSSASTSYSSNSQLQNDKEHKNPTSTSTSTRPSPNNGDGISEAEGEEEKSKIKTKKKTKKNKIKKKEKSPTRDLLSSTSKKKKKTKKKGRGANNDTTDDDKNENDDDEIDEIGLEERNESKPKSSRKKSNGSSKSKATPPGNNGIPEKEEDENEDEEDEDEDEQPGPPQESEFLIYFDPKTNGIGRINRAEAVAKSSLLVEEDDNYKNIIDDPGEKQQIILLLKKLERQKPAKASWLDSIKQEKTKSKPKTKFHKSTALISKRSKPAIRPATKPNTTTTKNSNSEKGVVGVGTTDTLDSGGKSKRNNNNSNYQDIYKQIAEKPDPDGWSKPASSRRLVQ